MANIIQILFGSPILIIGWIVVIIILGGVGFFLWLWRHEYLVLQLSEIDRQGRFFKIEDATGKVIRTEENKRFFRTAGSFNIRWGIRKVLTIFFGKLGTAYAFEAKKSDTDDLTLFDALSELLGVDFVQSLPVDKLTKILDSRYYVSRNIKLGTLWDALKGVWGDELTAKLAEEHREKIINSEVYVTVELEAGQTPEGFEPITEEDIKNEANKTFAKLLADGIKNVQKEDWIRTVALIGSGIAILAVMIMMGLTSL